ncbi:MAG: carbohydrate kinase family protein [Candidatus Bathyarchaeia archaeon]
MFDIITVGHFAIDFIIPLGEAKPKKRVGGPPIYVSLSAKKLGSSVSVISKVGGDFPTKYIVWLRKQDIDLSGLKICESSKTTSFLIIYRPDGERDMFLRGKAPPILIEDLPPSLRAKVLHISPIVGEFSMDLIMEAHNLAPLVSLDPQGLLRYFNDRGEVSLHRIDSIDFLRYVEIFKSSESEIKVLTGKESAVEALRKIRERGVKIAIATMGWRGVLISFNNKIFSVPAAKPRAIIDPTGAGDAFIGAFLSEYIRGENPLWCACVGTAASSFLIEKVGPRGFRGKRDVYRRAGEVYEKSLIIS